MPHPMIDDTFVLDTHAWIWIVEGKAEIADTPLLSRIEAASENSEVHIASISLWEVGMLESKGRISFTIPCVQWILNALKAPGITVEPLDPHIAVDSSNLPGSFHGDPADRLVVATARKLDAILVTRDRRILSYSAEGHVKTAII